MPYPARFLSVLVLLTGLSTAAGLAQEVAAPQPAGVDVRKVDNVLELFTSQGCVSCPPANRVLTKLAETPGVLALGYHVDYWDYIGWRDTLGSSENTDRQRDYARAFSTSTIYTPQMIVNGRTDIVGSREKAIRKAMNESRLDPAKEGADITMRVVGERLHITADKRGVPPGGPMPILVLVTYAPQVTTAIASGVNAGQTVVSTNPVRDWRVLGMWQGKPMEIDLPLEMLKRHAGRGGDDDRAGGCAVLLQAVRTDGSPGPILAATRLEFTAAASASNEADVAGGVSP